MGRNNKHYTEVVIVKLRPAEKQRLQELAQKTDRNMSEVIRELLALAEPTRQPLFTLGAGETR